MPVHKDTYRKMVLEKVLRAIREKWPDRSDCTVTMQQDNAPAHVHETDPDVAEHGLRYGWDIRLDNQPPNSPDFNILDLGFFVLCSQ